MQARSSTPLSTAGLYVQYGCGLSAPSGWRNFDASPRLKLERLFLLRTLIDQTLGLLFPANVSVGDIVRGLPLADASARAAYCSHVLEHLPRDEVPAALRNTFRILMPGGLFRLVVPDLQWRGAQYVSAAACGDAGAADRFVDGCLLGMRQRPATLMSRLRHQFGMSSHLWMYDFASLKALLEQAGFTGVRRAQFGDHEDPMFAQVEDEARFFESEQSELAIQAERPCSGANAANR
jgi:SAM-dependent methyltransferase